MDNGTYGQCGHRGQWGTGDMGHMGNEPHRGKVVQGYGDTGANGVWGMGNGANGVWGYGQ